MPCKLHLENYQNYYKPGDEIIGRVECYFRSSRKLRNIKILLKCKEYNQRTKSKLKGGPVTYRDENILFFKEQILYGSESDGNHHLRGAHTYHFKFVLPISIPSSFEGAYGSILYELKAIVDIPRGDDDVDCLNLTVKSPLYLDRFPSDELTQKAFEKEGSIGFFCFCTNDIISIVVIMPRMVFVIGENIDMMVKLTNLSSINVDHLKIKFDTIITFKVTSPSHRSKTTREEIFRVKKHGVAAHSEYTYNLSIPIPDHIEVPNFTNCQLFEVDYRLQLKAHPDVRIVIYPSLAHVSSQRTGNSLPSAPTIGFSTAPPTVPLATIDDSNINPPPYESLLSEKQTYPGGPPTAPFSPASAPPLTASTSGGATGPISVPPPF